MTSPFDFLNSVSFSKKDLLKEDPNNLKSYAPYIVNTSLSYFPDTIEYANKANMMYNLDPDMQYYYLLNTIRPRKRFSKWIKKEDNAELTAISRYYACSIRKAKTIRSLLDESQLANIKKAIELLGE